MSSSSLRRRAARPAPSRALAAVLALFPVLIVLGCAHGGRPEPPAPAPEAATGAATPPATAPGEPPGAGVEPAPEPESEPFRPAREAPPASAGAKLDPSEEITPEELATIPDPVPGGSGSPWSQGGSQARERPQGSTPAPSGGPGTSEGETSAINARERPWSVQIFASEDRGEAQRVARSAAERLGIPARVDHEAPLYKVRVGRFAGEEEAQAARSRAIRAGYAGAFRVRAGAP